MPFADRAIKHRFCCSRQQEEEIDRLTEEQVKALKAATYVGMTPNEAKDYDARREKINKLIRELERYEKAQ